MPSRISSSSIRLSNGSLPTSTPNMVNARHEALSALYGRGQRTLSHAPAVPCCSVRWPGDPVLLGCYQADDSRGVLCGLNTGPADVPARGGDLYLVRPGLLRHAAMEYR